jgi:hypothetical protein
MFVEINGKKVDRDSFQAGFAAAHFESIKNTDPDKQKLKEIAEATAGNYVRDNSVPV